MAFPISPTTGQIATINGVTYTYDSTTSSWTRSAQSLPSLTVTVDTFTSDGSTLNFTLSITPASKELVSVNIDGVLQQKTAYNLNTNVITLTGTPIVGAIIEVKTINASAASILTGLVYDVFTGNGANVAYTLSTSPTNKNFTLVTIGGIQQQKTNYSVTDNVVTFSTAPPNNAPIEVTTFGPAIASTGVMAAGSNTQVQFNNAGTLMGASGLTYNLTSNTLTAGNITTSNITTTGTITSSGNITTPYIIANGSSLTSLTAANITGAVALATTATTSGTVTTNAQPNITSVGTLTSLNVSGTATLQLAADVLSTLTGATGVVAHDMVTGGVFYHTSPAANFTANFVNAPTTDGRVLMATLIIVQGASAYIANAVQIAGVAQTIKWANGAAPSGNANKVDIISFSLIRTGATWTVLGSASNFS